MMLLHFDMMSLYYDIFTLLYDIITIYVITLHNDIIMLRILPFIVVALTNDGIT